MQPGNKTKKLLTVRDIDQMIFLRFKSKAVQEGMKIGDALNQSMELWIKENEVSNRSSIKTLLKFRRSKKVLNVS